MTKIYFQETLTLKKHVIPSNLKLHVKSKHQKKNEISVIKHYIQCIYNHILPTPIKLFVELDPLIPRFS